jgi:hypothetical protein
LIITTVAFFVALLAATGAGSFSYLLLNGAPNRRLRRGFFLFCCFLSSGYAVQAGVDRRMLLPKPPFEDPLFLLNLGAFFCALWIGWYLGFRSRTLVTKFWKLA